MHKAALAVIGFVLLSTILAQRTNAQSTPIVNVQSGWQQAFSGQWLLVRFDGVEITDTHDMHEEGSPFINIVQSGYYRLEMESVVGLGFPVIPPLGSSRDRTVLLQRIPEVGLPISIAQVSTAANSTSQSLAFERTEFLLLNGDTLRLLFRYTTAEEYLWFIVPSFRLQFIRVP